jgi:hypothetical protein
VRNPDPTRTEKGFLQFLHGTTRRSSPSAWLFWNAQTEASHDRADQAPQRLPSVYRTKNRLRHSNARKAFIVKSLMWFWVPRSGEGRKRVRTLSPIYVQVRSP